MNDNDPQFTSPKGLTLVLGATGKAGRRVASRLQALNHPKRRMKHLTVIFLFASGLLLLAIGGTILVVPHAFYASDGIVLGSDPSLLSEIRAPGGFLASSGLCILAGMFRDHLRSLAVLLTVLVYGSFGLSRLLSLVLDGMPSDSLVIATIIEVTVAAIGLIILYWLSGNSLSASPHQLTTASRR